MKVGTAEIIPDSRQLRRAGRRIADTSSPLGGNGGGGDGPDGDSGDFSNLPNIDRHETPTGDKSKYIAWFLMMAVGMTFAGLLGAYLMIATNQAAEWKPFDLPVQIWISTAIILFSSITYGLGKRAVDRADSFSARKWFVATTVLGAAFISSQIVVWLDLVSRGFYMSGNPYAGFFYILTAAHLVHVAGGIIALGSILLKTWFPTSSETDKVRRRHLARSVGWYWHFMGFLWVVLFLMLGLWK